MTRYLERMSKPEPVSSVTAYAIERGVPDDTKWFDSSKPVDAVGIAVHQSQVQSWDAIRDAIKTTLADGGA